VVARCRPCKVRLWWYASSLVLSLPDLEVRYWSEEVSGELRVFDSVKSVKIIFRELVVHPLNAVCLENLGIFLLLGITLKLQYVRTTLTFFPRSCSWPATLRYVCSIACHVCTILLHDVHFARTHKLVDPGLTFAFYNGNAGNQPPCCMISTNLDLWIRTCSILPLAAHFVKIFSPISFFSCVDDSWVELKVRLWRWCIWIPRSLIVSK
jgi:hypothetical protein